MSEMSDDDLLAALGVEITPLKTSARTPREERMIAGFEDILRFREQQGRAPRQGKHEESNDIFERLYAVRLDQLRHLPEAQALLTPLDRFGLLPGASSLTISPQDLDGNGMFIAGWRRKLPSADGRAVSQTTR